MQLRILVGMAVTVGAAFFAASADATARPVTTQDRALLSRAPTYEETIAQQVAARLTGHDASVRCGPLGESDPRILGVTPLLNQSSFDYFLMRPAECTYLGWFHHAPARWDPRACAAADCARIGDIVTALAVVAHESYHVLGYSNEAQVECYGMQSIWYVANKLGASVAEAQALGALYATRLYANRRIQSPAYWSPECRDGGKYDLRPASHSWPS
jgi:hypothetical protein